ncbi:MAG: hypothetical protein WAR79_08865 [Melioribacteraceae bacterium]
MFTKTVSQFWVRVIAFLCLLLIIISTCKEPEPTSPEDTKDKPLAEKTIGSEGGVLETEDFKLEFTSGTLTETAQLKLYFDEDENPYPDNSLAKRYIIEGFPSEFKKPIKVKIKYSGSLGKSNYITFGENVFIPSLAIEEYSDKLIPAIDSSGFLVATIPISEIETNLYKDYKTQENGGWKIKFGGIFTNTEATTPQGHFKIIWLASGPANIDGMRIVGEHLENSYTKFLEPELGFNYENRTNWPVDVTIKKLPSGIAGLYNPSLRGRNYGNIDIDSDYFTNSDVKYTCIHEYFHLVQDLYDPRTAPFHATIYFFPFYWVQEATSSWSELLFSNDPNFLPSGYAPYKNAPFNGFQRGAEGGFANARDHGYGMSGVIIYLTQKYGNGIVKKIFENIKDGKQPIDAIRLSTESPQIWLESFFTDYLTNSRWDNSQMLNVPITPITPNTIIISIDENYPDISAKYFRYSLNGSFKENSELVFTLKNGTAIDNDLTILKKKSLEKVKLIDNSYDPEIKVNNINDLAKNGYDLICIVTNSKGNSPYTSITPLTLDVKLESSEEIVKTYKKAYIDLHVKGFFTRTSTDSSWEDPYFEFYSTDAPDQIGNTTKTSFSGSWSKTRTDSYPVEGTTVTQTGSISITFSENFDKILTYSETFSVSWPGWYNINGNVSVKNIPFSEHNWDNSDTYLLSAGESTCGNVLSRSYSQVWSNGYSYTFSRNECNDESYIEIKLYE